MSTNKKPDAGAKHFRDNDKKNARNEFDAAQHAVRVKTEKLRALRLAKEAEEKAAAALLPQKPARKKAVRKAGAWEKA